jgi:hypothetical protein
MQPLKLKIRLAMNESFGLITNNFTRENNFGYFGMQEFWRIMIPFLIKEIQKATPLLATFDRSMIQILYPKAKLRC